MSEAQLQSFIYGKDEETVRKIAMDALHYLLDVEHARIAENGSVVWTYCGDEIGDI